MYMTKVEILEAFLFFFFLFSSSLMESSATHAVHFALMTTTKGVVIEFRTFQ